MKFKVGDVLPPIVLESVTGKSIKIPDPNRLIHLQFRRFIDCPICNTHIGDLIRRATDIKAAGIGEVILFHSQAKAMRPYQQRLPFTLVADPKKAIYREFGVEFSLRFLSPKALGALARGVANGHFGRRMGGKPFGLPADFLIAPTGELKAVKYGKHAYDQWSADELLDIAKDATASQRALN